MEWHDWRDLITGAAAVTALAFSGYQISLGRRSANLKALQDFFDGASKRERALADATDDASVRHAFF